tara:strand:- start:1106 stop:1771 length:666 start_codon:yes stop_codon:yes gene_type:complete
MNEPERILFFIKFGKKKYLESLLKNGELFFNAPKVFNKIKETNTEQGDENEGAIWIKNSENVELTINHPEIGEYKFKSIPNKVTKLTQFNHNYLICSFYAITNRDFEQSKILEIDERMSNFGEYALIISNTKLLTDSIINSAEKEGLSLSGKKVEYKELSILGRIELNPFIKKIEHSYQKEYRLVIKNSLESSKILKVCELGENGKIIPTENLKKLKFEIK